MKRRAKFNLAMSIPQKLQRIGDILSSMSGNPSFPAPTPDLDAVSNAVASLQKAYQAALDRSLTAKAEQRTKNDDLNSLIRQLRDYVNGIANGDEDIVLGSGFEASKIPTPVGPMPQIQKVTAKGGDGDGSVFLRWKSVYGAKSYVVEISTDGVTYAPVLYPLAASVLVEDLEIGKFYWFKIAANGAAGLGPFSVAYKTLAS
ncbi:MAG: fibronectin type III domain-containing protein [Flavobacteriales bacterium]